MDIENAMSETPCWKILCNFLIRLHAMPQTHIFFGFFILKAILIIHTSINSESLPLPLATCHVCEMKKNFRSIFAMYALNHSNLYTVCKCNFSNWLYILILCMIRMLNWCETFLFNISSHISCCFFGSSWLFWLCASLSVAWLNESDQMLQDKDF